MQLIQPLSNSLADSLLRLFSQIILDRYATQVLDIWPGCRVLIAKNKDGEYFIAKTFSYDPQGWSIQEEADGITIPVNVNIDQDKSIQLTIDPDPVPWDFDQNTWILSATLYKLEIA